MWLKKPIIVIYYYLRKVKGIKPGYMVLQFFIILSTFNNACKIKKYHLGEILTYWKKSV
jgi:hypothetical protein